MKGKTRIRTWDPEPLVRCSIKLTGIKFKSQCKIAQSIEYLAGDSGCSGLITDLVHHYVSYQLTTGQKLMG